MVNSSLEPRLPAFLLIERNKLEATNEKVMIDSLAGFEARSTLIFTLQRRYLALSGDTANTSILVPESCRRSLDSRSSC